MYVTKIIIATNVYSSYIRAYTHAHTMSKVSGEIALQIDSIIVARNRYSSKTVRNKHIDHWYELFNLEDARLYKKIEIIISPETFPNQLEDTITEIQEIKEKRA